MVSLVEKNTFLEVSGLDEDNEFGPCNRRSIISEPPEAIRRMSCLSGASGADLRERRQYGHLETIHSVGHSEFSGFYSFRESLTSIRTQYLPKEMYGRQVLVDLGGDKWRATNRFLQVDYPNGLYYQKCKRADILDTDTEFVQWDTVLDNGFDEGDGWVSFEVKVTLKEKEAMSPLQRLRMDYEQERKVHAVAPAVSDSESQSDAGSCDGQPAAPATEPRGVTTDPSDDRTTLMVRGLSTDLNQAGFVQHFMNGGYAGYLNFAYMPMNFRKPGCSFGYAFVNFSAHEVAESVITKLESAECPQELQGWSASWSSSQGWDGNIERYRNSPLMHPLVPAECKPAVFDENGDQVPFPKPTKSIPKPRAQKPVANTDSTTPSDCPPPEQFYMEAPGLGSVGYPTASASPPTATNSMMFGDAEQGLKHRPGRCKRRQPRKKKDVSSPSPSRPMQVPTPADQIGKVNYAPADPAFISINI